MSHPSLPTLRTKLRYALTGPHILAFLPAAVLGSYWIGGEGYLLAISLGFPIFYALAGGFGQFSRPTEPAELPPMEVILETRLQDAHQRQKVFASFLIALDDYEELLDRYGRTATDRVLERVTDRVGATLRQGDLILRPEQDVVAVILAPVRMLDLEAAIQLARRLQAVVEEPISMDATSVFISCSIGFTLSQQNSHRNGMKMMQNTLAAMDDARANAPSAIRAWSEGMKPPRLTRSNLADQAARALENGEIHPWFQPQISTDTGHITGFETLARWVHPEQGIIPPGDFLPVLESVGMLERLGEVMLTGALTALTDWDRSGVHVPTIGVNFAEQELRNPKLVEKVQWELDRFEQPPERLSVEVLETVVAASPDDIIARNINALSEMGCSIDLDDFGTGHASISSIRRFAVQRIKIDRSFIMKVDRDPEQQRMVAAILSMAERLGLETLAEGVESAGEHTLLAQLGCGFVQGFGIARPMPFDQTLDWVRAHEAKVKEPPLIGRKQI
ncbi:GGDEF domain-containing phosphodiesterase [Thalassovita sp.]|uniref:putative bifunctional diguanylate cyclase/phosphodiesterase n=1 Tax=Thalassovita sp. TaxID=1979401 RepID=UPI002880E278|nr:GGDEF domain-containing phosphodiesterase [Thalassovita sp.]MDF1804420.1 GGDEF domain-containing phosphodiesterase [Thalassovita sp.]